MGPLSEAQLTLACYGTAVGLNLVITVYGFIVAKHLGGQGVFAKTASFTSWAALAFAAYNGAAAMLPADSLATAGVEIVGTGLLAAATYQLYTLVKG